MRIRDHLLIAKGRYDEDEDRAKDEVERIDHISDEMRAVVESEWPDLAHKLPPKA